MAGRFYLGGLIGRGQLSPFLRRRTAAASTEPARNIGECGGTITTSLQDEGSHTIAFQNIAKGDGILVVAMAPPLPSGGANEGYPVGVTDNAGNTYTFQALHSFYQNPTVVNRGHAVSVFYCESSTRELVAGSDTVTVFWSNPVYDRIVSVYQVRPGGAAGRPVELGASLDQSAAIYAATSVTLTAPDYTPTADFGLEFALITTSKPGGTGAFGGVVGYNGFFQPLFRLYTGSQQTYYMNPQFHGADVYTVAGAVPAIYYFALGVLPSGVLVPAFNGVGQNYAGGANADKGIILFGKPA